MKNKINYILLFFTIIISCKAQTISLDQLSQCENGPDCPDYVYLKDTNNRLNKFVGTWKGTYTDGRTYEFRFTKKENDGGYFNEKFCDILKGRLLVKIPSGQELENTLTVSDNDTRFDGHYFDKNLIKYQMYYSGYAECNDKGYVYLSFPNPNNLNQMKLVFMQDMDIVSKCPSGYKTVMPDAKALILTKQ
ncbi:DUF6705 family protein [Chryseobacterium populi]|uniref:DUF6705 domain-containing protein n=1 Tax=Chryseobacterium populi TaxID=1144316 RepID=J2SQT5_9FLAO|nr:DUF6705 family protein [Chryseobacterium populi]EJL67917.1 hypothetical protein PMI13_04016 [Chryseobacterium populi]